MCIPNVGECEILLPLPHGRGGSQRMLHCGGEGAGESPPTIETHTLFCLAKMSIGFVG